MLLSRCQPGKRFSWILQKSISCTCASVRRLQPSTHLRSVFHRDLCWDRSCSPHMYRRTVVSTTVSKLDITAVRCTSVNTGFQFRQTVELYHSATILALGQRFCFHNTDKYEADFSDTKPCLWKPGLPSSISVAGCSVTVSVRLKILSVMLDSSLSFDDRVSDEVRACNCHLRSLRYVRRSVTRDIVNTLACIITGSRIDYCNALLHGVSKKTVDRLQQVQNGLALVVCYISVRELHDSGLNSMDLLKERHWLLSQNRIEFKVVTLCYKAYRLGTPSYLASSLQQYISPRMLCSSNQDQLTVPASRIKLTSRKFSASTELLLQLT